MAMRRRAAALPLFVVLASAPLAQAGPPPSGPFGHGSAEVWLLRPRGPVRDVVVFGHGWKMAPPSPSYPWVGQFLPWLEHLADRGNAIVFPRYQLGGRDAQNASRVRSFAAGIRLGYRLLGRPRVPVVVVGYSFGASLAFSYAANALAWHLPGPRAVQAIFPAGIIAGAPLPPLPSSISVLIQVGDADTEAGRRGADAFWHWLAGHPASRKRYQLIRSTPQLAATHAAPKSAGRAARAAFWAPLDRLIAEARRG